MEGYLRDLLCGIGKGDAPPREQSPPRLEMEDLELTLGLSLGGRFVPDRKEGKLARAAPLSVLFTTPVEVAAPPPLPRTSSLPVDAEASEVGSESIGLAVEHVARRPASGSPSSSSDPEEGRLQGTLMRASSLPAGIDSAGTEEWRKRKAAQSLKRLEVKKKRIERRNSHTCNASKEAIGQIVGENAEKPESFNEAAVKNNENHRDGKHLMKGPNSAFKAMAKEHSPSSAVQSPGSVEDHQNISGGAAGMAGSMGDVERMMMQEMPGVFTRGLPNGNRVEGFLYKYRKGEEVRIVCICHGNFLTPAEFIEHAGGGIVANPLRHIVVNPLQNL